LGEYTWEFRKDAESEEKPIECIASEYRFYGDPGKKPDKRITKKEIHYGDVIHQIRAARRDLPIKIPSGGKKHLVVMITDMIKRTKRVRELTKSIVMEQYRATIEPERLAERVTDNPVSSAMVRKFLDKLGEHLESMVDKTHSKVSGDSMTPDSKFQRYWDFTWSVEASPSGPFILGNFGPVVVCGPELTINFAFSHTEKARAVLLPIAHDLLLIGRAPQEEFLQLPDEESLNVAMVELSRDFFVSRQSGPREASYRGHLGHRADEERG
jgi:hypothetical protein